MIRQKCPKLYKNGIVFECGKGWSHIILELSLDIEALLEKKPHYSEIYAIQVKEKYGTLRFYMTLETDEITALIEDAEALSSQTCESCGSSGKMRGVRWMEVKCEECFKDLIWR
jgi:hypothetical protein